MRTKNGGGFDGDAEATAHISVKNQTRRAKKAKFTIRAVKKRLQI